jgi:hypothetical protein
MATQPKNKHTASKQKEASSKKKTATVAPTSFQKNLPFIITGIFFLLSVIGIMNHEMWRDELQAWMVARDAHSIAELFQNVKYEGHPALWHLFLFALSSITHDPFIMQVFHVLIATTFVFLINRYAPFTMITKILITFGYYSFYEYSIISRNYGLGFLFVVIILMLYKNRRQHYILISVVLFFLANTHVHALILSGLLAAVLLIDYIQKVRAGEFENIGAMKIALCCVIVISGWTASFLQIKPEADNSFPVNYPKAGEDNAARWTFAIYKIATTYYAIPKLEHLHFWNTNILEPLKLKEGVEIVDNDKLNVFLPLVTFLIFFFCFLRKPLILALYTAGTLIFIYLFYYTALTHSRYCSHLFVLLLACMWIENYYKEKNYSEKWLNTLSVAGKKGGKILFTIVLVAGFIGGVGSYVKDLNAPFTASNELVDFLKENNYEEIKIYAVSDFIVSPVAGLLDRTLYYPQRKYDGSFIIWDQKRIDAIDYGVIINEMQEDAKRGLKKMLFITDNPLKFVNPNTQQSEAITEGMIAANLHVQLLKNIKAGVVPDEKYFVYLVEEKVNS